MTRTPQYLNSDIEELNETGFHLMMKFEDDLFRILVNTGVTHSYVGKEPLKRILSSNYSIFKPISQSLKVVIGETLEIIGQVVIPIRIDKYKK